MRRKLDEIIQNRKLKSFHLRTELNEIGIAKYEEEKEI
jgi:hypothetical protein